MILLQAKKKLSQPFHSECLAVGSSLWSGLSWPGDDDIACKEEAVAADSLWMWGTMIFTNCISNPVILGDR